MYRFLSLSLVLLLSACNSGEDFSDADLGGPVVQPSPTGSPINAEGNDVAVVFAPGGAAGGTETAGVINNLLYSCGDRVNYIPAPPNPTDDEGNPIEPNVALCPVGSRSIEFFIGPQETQFEDKRLSIGKAWLPATSQQGRFQITPADLLESPSRVEPSVPQARNIAAFLQALDGDSSTPKVIDVSDEAHAMLLNCCDVDNPAPPEPAFTQSNYNDFKADWNDWISEYDSRLTGSQALPQNASEAVNQLELTLDRIRAGTFNAQSLGLTEFGFVLAQLGREQNIAFQISTLVYPDGQATGAGLSVLKGASGESSVIALDSTSANLDTVQQMSGWNASEVSGQDSVTLGLQGRVLGTFAYYNESGERTKADYEVDYPDSSYEPLPSDEARYTASGLGSSGDDVTDGLWWLTRTGQVAVTWDRTVVQKLALDEDDRFYDIEFRRPCVNSNLDESRQECPDYDSSGEPSGGQQAYEIPEQEFDLNYLEFLDLDGGGSTDPGLTITHERPKEWGNSLNTAESLRVQILDNGDVITDIDRDCALVSGDPQNGYSDGDTEEYRVGFVSRTERDDQGAAESFNIVLLMTGTSPGAQQPIYQAHDDLPHYGTQVAGRIDVSGVSGRDGNFYRLGDSNFDNGIRAFWTDFYLPRQKEESYGSLSLEEQREVSVSASGAAQGSPVDSGTCQP